MPAIVVMVGRHHSSRVVRRNSLPKEIRSRADGSTVAFTDQPASLPTVFIGMLPDLSAMKFM